MAFASPRSYMLISVAAAVATIVLKTAAWKLTGSVGLLSDAMESGVNLVAALGAFWALTLAAKPADRSHHYGHFKAEYFSSGLESVLIVVAALAIISAAVGRLQQPEPLEQLGIGLALSLMATVLNALVAWILLKASRRFHSITLRADAHHLLTDVWTSFGVVLGIGLVHVTGLTILDPLIAIAVALNIWIDRCLRTSKPRWRPCSPPMKRRTSTSMPCAPGWPDHADSWPSMCWCRGAGRCRPAMISATSWSGRSPGP
jgi:cation diffusion facilitator family transporter